MSFSSDLFSFVTSAPTISAIIGNRLYPNILPQNSITAWPGPSATYNNVVATRTQSHDGDSNLRVESVQFSVFSKRKSDLESFTDALAALLIPLKGAMGSTQVKAVFHVQDSSSYETETRLFHGIVEFEIWHQS